MCPVFDRQLASVAPAIDCRRPDKAPRVPSSAPAFVISVADRFRGGTRQLEQPCPSELPDIAILADTVIIDLARQGVEPVSVEARPAVVTDSHADAELIKGPDCSIIDAIVEGDERVTGPYWTDVRPKNGVATSAVRDVDVTGRQSSLSVCDDEGATSSPLDFGELNLADRDSNLVRERAAGKQPPIEFEISPPGDASSCEDVATEGPTLVWQSIDTPQCVDQISTRFEVSSLTGIGYTDEGFRPSRVSTEHAASDSDLEFTRLAGIDNSNLSNNELFEIGKHEFSPCSSLMDNAPVHVGNNACYMDGRELLGGLDAVVVDPPKLFNGEGLAGLMRPPLETQLACPLGGNECCLNGLAILTVRVDQTSCSSQRAIDGSQGHAVTVYAVKASSNFVPKRNERGIG